MKKIAVFAPLSSGHVQKWLYEFKDDYEFIFCTLHDSNIKDIFGSSKKYVFPKITGSKIDFLLSILYFQVILLKEKPDLIYSSYLSSYGILTSLLRFKSPSVLSVWGSDVNGNIQNSNILKKIAKYALKRFDIINAPANHMVAKLVKLGADSSKIDVYQYGVNISNYTKKNSIKKHDIVRFISIRNWDDIYNIGNIIESFSIFNARHYGKCSLTIIGRGSNQNKIEEMAKDNNIIIKGFLSQKELSHELSVHDICISIPDMDGTPLSLLESLYVGLIPIVSDIDANREWLNSDSAFFVDPKNILSIVNGFESSYQFFLNDNVIQIIKRNRDLVVELADYNKNTSRLKNTFEKLIG